MAKKPDVPFAAPEWPAINPEMWKLDRIKPYPKNPRTHPPEQITLLANLMKKSGVDQPIVVDEVGVILKGHGRRLAAIEAGFAEFPVVIHHGLSETDKRAMRIEDNQIPLLSGWDSELMRVEIGLLRMDGYEISLLGFTGIQLAEFEVQHSSEDPDETPEPPKSTVIRRGDVWKLGKHTLICGDSTNKEDVLRCMDGKKPHLCVTDPPYGVEYDPEWRLDSNNWKGAKVKIGGKAMGKVQNDHMAEWDKAWRLFPGAVMYVWHGVLRSVEQAQGIEKVGFIIRSQIVWDKTRLVISRGDYHWQHECCWYAVRKGETAHWNGSRKETTIWQIPKPQASETGHGTQKPIECMKRPIENNSKAGEFIYEPFSGSGTTIIACEMTGRYALAIEIDPLYVEVAIKRWEAYSGKKATLDGRTLEQVEKERKRKQGKTNATRNSGKPVQRKRQGDRGAAQGVRKKVHASQPEPRGEPAGKPSALAGNS